MDWMRVGIRSGVTRVAAVAIAVVLVGSLWTTCGAAERPASTHATSCSDRTPDCLGRQSAIDCVKAVLQSYASAGAAQLTNSLSRVALGSVIGFDASDSAQEHSRSLIDRRRLSASPRPTYLLLSTFRL